MEWNIKNSSSCCGSCKNSFSDGDKVISYVYIAENGEIVRSDVHEDCVKSFELPGRLLGQWKRAVSVEKADKSDFLQRLITQEEFFFSLFEGDSNREKELLKVFLSLFLEKNRILRSDPHVSEGRRRFIHVKTRKEFFVPDMKILPEELASVLNAFDILFQ